MSIKGTGEVFDGDKSLTKVKYDLTVSLDTMNTTGFDTADRIGTRTGITGTIFALGGTEGLLNQDNLILHLDNRKKLKILILKDAPFLKKGKSYEIIGSGKFYD
jgi:hypothetical protein